MVYWVIYLQNLLIINVEKHGFHPEYVRCHEGKLNGNLHDSPITIYELITNYKLQGGWVQRGQDDGDFAMSKCDCLLLAYQISARREEKTKRKLYNIVTCIARQRRDKHLA
jgi:hypothetical protein